jgi:flagellar hook-length control protein FliK
MSLPIAFATPSPRASATAPRQDAASADGFAVVIRDEAAAADALASFAPANPDASAEPTEHPTDVGGLTGREQVILPGALPSTPETLPSAPPGDAAVTTSDAKTIEPLQSAGSPPAEDADVAAVQAPGSAAGDAAAPTPVAQPAPGQLITQTQEAAQSQHAAQTLPPAQAQQSAQAQQTARTPEPAQATGSAADPITPRVTTTDPMPASARVVVPAPAQPPVEPQPVSPAPPASSPAQTVLPAQRPSAQEAPQNLRLVQTGEQTPTAPAATPGAALPVASAPSPDQATAATSAPRPVLLPQLAAPVIALARSPQGEHSITLTVRPENLGPVTVRAHISGSSIRLELHAPSDAGREALRVILADLRRDLSAAAPGASVDLSARDATSDAQARPDSQGRFDLHGRADEQSRGEPRGLPRTEDGTVHGAREPASVAPVPDPHLSSSHPRIDVYA